MKTITAATAAGVVALALATGAQADRGGVPHRKAPTAPTSTFVCDGMFCTFTVPVGLEPLTAYDTSIQFENLLGPGGCNTGTGGWRSDGSGVLVQVLDESEIKCGGIGPGIVTAWARDAGTTFNAPAIAGSLVFAIIG